jgi:uncharacterized protein YdaU (DUF1376 family)
MPFYVGDYLADTTHLTAAESGAYLFLIMHYWQKGSLPTDEAILARICRLTAREWAKSRPVLAEFFSADWKHDRVEQELEKARIKSEARAECGARGGTAKSLKDKEAHLAKASVLPQQNVAKDIASSSQSQSSSLRSEDTRDARSRLMAREFDAIFWPEWPNKVGKPVAMKAFAKARAQSSLDQIMAGLRAYVASKPSDRPWLNPATFLNQERFNDRPAAAPRAGPERAGSGRNLFAQIAFGGGGYDEFTDGTLGQRGGSPDQAGGAGDGAGHFRDDEPGGRQRPPILDL